MTKEEYMQKLMGQFGEDETLIPEKGSAETKTTEQTMQEETQEAIKDENLKDEIQNGTQDGALQDGALQDGASQDGALQDGASQEAKADEDTSISEESIDGEDSKDPVNPENGKKYSNKKIKKTIWENKNLIREVQELKRQLEEMKAANAPKDPEKLAQPIRKNFQTDEDFANAVFAYNMQLLADKNREKTEAQMKQARVVEEQQRVFKEKINDCIPEGKAEEFNSFFRETFNDLQQSLSMDAQNDIMSMSTTPLILWKLGQSPDLISHVNRMNQVERIMFCNKMAEQMSNELKSPAGSLSGNQVPQKKAPVIGKVGTGKSATKNMDEMSEEEMYSYITKRLAGG